jgi:hypothetical protein
MVHKFSKMLSCVVNGIRVGVWVDIKTCVGVRLGGIEVGVKVAEGIEVYVGRKVEVGFPRKFLAAGISVGVGLRDGMKARHANRMSIIGSKTRIRILKFINDNITARSNLYNFPS